MSEYGDRLREVIAAIMRNKMTEGQRSMWQRDVQGMAKVVAASFEGLCKTNHWHDHADTTYEQFEFRWLEMQKELGSVHPTVLMVYMRDGKQGLNRISRDGQIALRSAARAFGDWSRAFTKGNAETVLGLVVTEVPDLMSRAMPRMALRQSRQDQDADERLVEFALKLDEIKVDGVTNWITSAPSMRSPEEQDKAFDRGTSPIHFGDSPHNFYPSYAMDCYPQVPREVSENGLSKEHEHYRRMGELAESMGLRWGGRWGDNPHIEVASWRTEVAEVFIR